MKSEETLKLENRLFNYLQQIGIFCVFECQLGFHKSGRVDCISITSKSVVTCYELKVTKSDFHSKNGHNFSGHLNYYVMPKKLYEEVKHEIPLNIGVLIPSGTQTLVVIKKPKRQKVENIERVKMWIIRSLYREYQKSFYKKALGRY